MGSTNYLNKSKPSGFRTKSGSSVGSDKEINGKLKRAKIRRPGKMNEYGLKRIPDYTELAYKEAVSKLRYFLSGNYAPSIRSYGISSSIKNLDESDGDIDKKLSSYALSEFKPRPRLTTKYSTLYADSLNNYAQNNTVPPPQTTSSPADLSGGTNPDVINFIQKQEEYIEQLERESQYCRDELNNLLGKVKEVISENEHLHEAQKNKIISRMFQTYNNGSESDELDDVGDSTGLDSDNKATPFKSRKSQKSRVSKLEGPNIVFESRIAELEAQLAQAKIDLKKIQDENNENKRKLASGLVDSTCLDGFKRQIDNLQRDKNSLEAQIVKLKLNLEQKDGDEGRYKRSDAVEQQLRDERNNLEMEVRRLKDDLTKERSKVRELAGEGARRAVQERSAAEQRYTAHFDELQRDLAAQYDNVAKLQLDLERQRREENDLKRELSIKNSALEEIKMDLKNKTASLQADLSQAHAEKASLEEELASARLALERQQRQAKHETNRLNSEIQSLRQRLDRADADLVHSRRENLRLSGQICALEKEINMKNLTPISPEKSKKEKEFSSVLESMENKHARTVAELESMIQSQNSLMEKLTGECRLLTDKLDDANRRHKQSAESQLRRTNQNTARPFKITRPREELGTLQRQVDRLGRSLQEHPSTPNTYQAQATHTPTANRNAHATSDDGSDNSRVNSTGLSSQPGLREHPVSNVRSNGNNGHEKPRMSRQSSKTTLPEYEKETVKSNDNAEIPPKYDESIDSSVNRNANEEVNEENTMEVENQDQNYGVGDYGNYDQNYEQTGEYQNQYDPSYQQGYSQEQYPQYEGQNYEQYPQFTDNNPQYTDNNPQFTDTNPQYTVDDPQYTDPNVQHEQSNAEFNQYEDYATKINYQDSENLNYDNAPSVNAENEQQFEQNVPTNENTESKRSNSPNEKANRS